MKLKVHEKKLIVLGCTHEENDWGHYQFPQIFKLQDGTLCVSIHMAEDSARAYGSERPFFVSRDEGNTWTPVKEDMRPKCGLTLPDGKILSPISRTAVNVAHMKESKLFEVANGFLPDMPLEHAKKSTDPNVLPTTVYRKQNGYGLISLYHMDTLPDELADPTFPFMLYDPETDTSEEYLAPLDWPNMVAKVVGFNDKEKLMVRPFLYGNLKKAPDGSIWAIHYEMGCDPKTGGFSPYHTPYILRSEDNGRSFRLHSYLPYFPDTELDPLAFLREGYPEPDVEFMPDGSVIMVMRTCGIMNGGPNFGPTFFTRSTDGGVTWDKPRVFDRYGVLPQLRRLECGVTLAIYGRPGIFVRATADPSGQQWDAPIEIMTPENRIGEAHDPSNPGNHPFHRWEGSCCNLSAAVLDDHRIMITYSDFYIPAENGVKRKGCYSQIIEVID